MSELKDYSIYDIQAIDNERLENSESGKIQETRVYIKSEADEYVRKLKRSLWLARAKAAEYKADSINGTTVVGLMTNPKEIRKRRQSKLFKAMADKFKEEL